jgi:hypothetical protein
MLRRVRVWIACTASITAVCLLTLVAADPAFGQGSPFVVYSATGPDTAGIEPVVNAFRAILGNNNGNTFGQQPGGRREINWDGGGAAVAWIFGRGFHGRKAIGIVVSMHRAAVPAASGLNFHLLAAAATESRMFD